LQAPLVLLAEGLVLLYEIIFLVRDYI